MNTHARFDFDNRELRNALGRFFTGVTVVTTLDSEKSPQGITINSFSSVSLDPPLILWSQARTSKSYPTFLGADRFTVNILAENQQHLADHFSRGSANRFEDIAVNLGIGGIPILSGCCAVFECRKTATYDGGDHAIYIGQVETIYTDNKLTPLIFGDGNYQKPAPL